MKLLKNSICYKNTFNTQCKTDETYSVGWCLTGSYDRIAWMMGKYHSKSTMDIL